MPRLVEEVGMVEKVVGVGLGVWWWWRWWHLELELELGLERSELRRAAAGERLRTRRGTQATDGVELGLGGGREGGGGGGDAVEHAEGDEPLERGAVHLGEGRLLLGRGLGVKGHVGRRASRSRKMCVELGVEGGCLVTGRCCNPPATTVGCGIRLITYGGQA